MTGTAMTEAEEFHKIYELEVVAIPTHQDMIRDDEADLVFRNEMRASSTPSSTRSPRCRRPAGRSSSARSASRSPRSSRRCSSGAGIKHETLNAKFHEKESGIVAQAGRTGAVTIATNMAGRGTDIKLGGDPAGLASEMLHKQGLNPAEVDKATYDAALAEAKAITDEDHEKVVAAGGLHIIGTERHDSRRIDNQLRGRAGRQGDPGSSRFYLSLEDDLMKRFASDRVAGLMERMGLEDDVAIESRHRRQDDRERPEPGRGLQLRHAQARRRVRRRHQPPARDDLRGARQGPPQRGPDRDGPGLPRGRDPGARRPATSSARRADDWGMEGARRRAQGDGPRRRARARPRTTSGTLGGTRRDPRAPPATCAGRASSRPTARGRGRRGGLGARRAARPAPDDRLAVGRAPDRARRHAARHRPARLRPAGPAQRVPAGGVRALRASCAASSATRSRRRSSGSPSPASPARRRGRSTASARPRRSGAARTAAAAAAARSARPRPGAASRRAGQRPAGAARSGRRRSRPRRRAASPSDPMARGRLRDGGERRAGATGQAKPGLHADRRPDRPQRPVLVRLGPEVQEVPRPLTRPRRRPIDRPGRRRSHRA